MHKPKGLLSGFLVAVHSVTLHEEPQTLTYSYLGASQGVRLQLYRVVFFVYLMSVSKVILDTLS